ncbi:hypothetical protein CROQUDRAFT_49229 [Cronartium quercuum f. sp. fusiforme G11]|uniref:Stretch-activated cation channel mid1 n=1 Tax=Cronartium quercuum f. sp. fusiforme G11 TaxID=708437 RepID=A0A9P6NAU5_9BASI|nr:hypothetical protein CROQUDRAFT_49229 [Cronartium quercuum f. sp. fusiforme G11]
MNSKPFKLTWIFNFSILSSIYPSQSQSQPIINNEITNIPIIIQSTVTGSSPSRYHLPPPTDSHQNSDPTTISITLNICNPPPNHSNSLQYTYQHLLIVSNSSNNISPDNNKNLPNSKSGRIASTWGGFGNITIINSIGLWISIYSPTPDDDSPWSIELGIDDQPIHQVNSFPAFKIEDTDTTNALITATDSSLYIPFTTQNPFSYDFIYPIIIPTPTNLLFELSSSLCYLQNLNQSIKSIPLNSIQSSLTTRSLGLNMPSSQTSSDSTDRDYRILPKDAGKRTQYYINNLLPSTNYSAWLFQPLKLVNNIQSGRLWPYVNFKTKNTNNCKLLYDLDFCPELAYSVPSPPNLNSTNQLISTYKSIIETNINNFTTVLSTYPCNNDTSGRYSFVTGCDDCKRSYINWACSIILPRCTDDPPDLSSSSQLILRNDPTTSRTPFFNFSYTELLPCISLCTLVSATCPPFLSWNCPTYSNQDYQDLSYLNNWQLMGGQQTGNNLNGNGGFRSGDRFGHFFCNSLGSDLDYSRMGFSLQFQSNFKFWFICLIGFWLSIEFI